MELEVMKKLIKRYEPGHVGFAKRCETAERYYRNRTDIFLQQKKEDGEGNPMRNADNRIPHNFHGLIVNQKASYAFTAPPLFNIGGREANQRVMDALGDGYKKGCMELCVNAANCGIAWVHYWRGDNGFEWSVVDSKEVIPVMSRKLKRKLLGVFRAYADTDEASGDAYMVYEYWTEAECQAFRRRIGDTVDEGLLYYDMFMDPATGDMTSQYRHDMGGCRSSLSETTTSIRMTW